MSKKYDKYVEELQQDALTMALRLLGEDANSFSPECREVMDRWRPIAERVLNAPQQPDTLFEEMCDIVMKEKEAKQLVKRLCNAAYMVGEYSVNPGSLIAKDETEKVVSLGAEIVRHLCDEELVGKE